LIERLLADDLQSLGTRRPRKELAAHTVAKPVVPKVAVPKTNGAAQSESSQKSDNVPQ
jgi:hypothetical protein